MTRKIIILTWAGVFVVSGSISAWAIAKAINLVVLITNLIRG